MQHARGRPRKSDAEKLLPLSTNVSAPMYRVLRRIADARGLHVSEVVRRIIAGRLAEWQPVDVSHTIQ